MWLSLALLEEIVETDVVPQLLAVAIVEGTGHLNRNHEVAVHHNLYATACGHVQFILISRIEGVVLVERVIRASPSIVCGLLLLHAVGLDDLSHVEEGVEGDVEVLVDEAEVYDAPAELGVEPCYAIAHHAIAVDTAHRCVSAQALGVDLTEEEGVDVVDEVVGNFTCELGLHTEAVGKGEAILIDWHILTAHEGEAEVAVAFAVDDVGSTHESGLDVESACGVAIVVAGVVDEASLELEHITSICFVVADETSLTIEVVE